MGRELATRPTRGIRDSHGRYLAGHHSGRPKGITNKADLGLRAIKEAIVASWKTVDGAKLLKQLARKDPREYLRLIFSTLPRDANVSVQGIEIVCRSPDQLAFAQHVKRRTEADGVPTNVAVLEALAAVPVDLDRMERTLAGDVPYDDDDTVLEQCNEVES